MPKSDFIETEGTVMRMRGHGFYTVVLANGHEVLARMSGRMSKNHIRVIQDDRVLLEKGFGTDRTARDGHARAARCATPQPEQ